MMNKLFAFIIGAGLSVLFAIPSQATLYDFFQGDIPPLNERGASECGIVNYIGSASQNIELEQCLQGVQEDILGAPTVVYQRTILPEITNTYDLGSASKTWRGLYVNGITSTNFAASGTFSFPSITSSSILYTGQNGQVTGNSTTLSFNGSRIGIGTNNPSSTAHIFSSVPTLRIQDSVNTGAQNYIPMIDFVTASNVIRARIDLNTTQAGDLTVSNFSGSPNGNIKLNTASVNRLAISSGGLIGINSSTPQSLFSMNSLAGVSSLVDIRSSTLSSTTLFRINENGFVGIGTSTPTAPLEVVIEQSDSAFTPTQIYAAKSTNGTGRVNRMTYSAGATSNRGAKIAVTEFINGADSGFGEAALTFFLNELRIGNVGAYPVTFYSNNLEQGRFSSSGSGVGTTTPRATWGVQGSHLIVGDATTTGNSFLSGNNRLGGITYAGTAGSFVNDANLPIQTIGTLAGYGLSRTANTYGAFLAPYNATTYALRVIEASNNLSLVVGSTNQALNITSGGNVGIATTSPQALLTVGSQGGSIVDSNTPLQLSTGGDGTQVNFGLNKNGAYGFLFGYLNKAALGSIGLWEGSYFRNVTADRFAIVMNSTNVSSIWDSTGNAFLGGNIINSSTYAGATMAVKASGQVGIGTSTPHTGAILTVSNTNSGVAAIDLLAPNVGGAPWQRFSVGDLNVAEIQNNGGFEFESFLNTNNNSFLTNNGSFIVKGGSSGATEYFRVNNGGNVGVNTSSPTAALSIKSFGNTTGLSFNVLNSTGTTTFKIFDNGHQATSSTKPTITQPSPGTVPVIVGNDNRGTITMNNATSTLTMTFGAAWTGAPSCNVNFVSTTNATIMRYTISNTAITFNTTTGSGITGYQGSTIHYNCGGISEGN